MSSSVDNADRIEQIDHDNHMTLWAGSRNNSTIFDFTNSLSNGKLKTVFWTDKNGTSIFL